MSGIKGLDEEQPASSSARGEGWLSELGRSFEVVTKRWTAYIAG